MKQFEQEEQITISLSKKYAEKFSYDIADVLCWWQGFKAGIKQGEDFGEDYTSICNDGIKAIREINIRIKDELRK
jgi:hypothetical protein